MISILKKIFIFILCLAPWFITYLLPIDYSFYNEIKLPFFAPPNIFYIIAWTITYIGIAISIYKIVTNFKWSEIPNSYKIVLLINYISNQSYVIVFFIFKNLFLGFIACLINFISTLYLYEQTDSLDEKSTKYLNPYVLLGLFATILSVTIYIINTR